MSEDNNNNNNNNNETTTTHHHRPRRTDLDWPAARVRQTFIDYFHKKHGHVHWPSSPCVPSDSDEDDHALLFTNAGMNQFRGIFLGNQASNSEMDSLRRACSSQKCIRAGGKHNDLEDVGRDGHHHTFFEMLGNWSFNIGDDCCNFKKTAIELSYRCLVEEFGLDPSRLYATYFGGGGDDGVTTIPPDCEARDIWLEYLPKERVLPFGARDNFWDMGASGPCGPCTEIHYDRIGGGRDASHLVNTADDDDAPGDDVMEIWNIVFIQYDRQQQPGDGDGTTSTLLRALPHRHVDTGLGFERLASILQHVDSNYDTDLFVPILDEIHTITGAPRPYRSGRVVVGGGDADDDSVDNIVDAAYRVVADHIRTLCFAIADGAVPGSTGRGYVVRRILRRAVWYGRRHLGAGLGFLSRLVPIVTNLMGDAYPELKEKQALVTNVILEEERSFSRTLDKGIKQFNKRAGKVGDDRVFPVKDAHFLKTSVGLPVDLIQLMARDKGMTIDMEEFEEYMEREKIISQGSK